MKRQWLGIMAAAMLISLSARAAAAQAPAGVGADGAAQNSNTQHSYNPIKWAKKDSQTTNASANPNTIRNAKLTSKLQMQGLLAPNANLDDTCSPIKGLGECVAVLHAGRDLGLDFNCLKSKITGTGAGANPQSCPGAATRKPMTLDNAIHQLMPAVNGKVAAKNAERQSSADLREAGS
jgi:hypothetical protein